MHDLILVFSELVILQCALNILGAQDLSLLGTLGTYFVIKVFLQ